MIKLKSVTIRMACCILLFILPAHFLFAQKTKPKKQPPNNGKKFANVGFAYNLVDSDPSVPKKDSIYGFSAMFWKGLSKKFDISARYNGIFSNKINNTFFSPNKNRMSSEIEIAVHAKALRDRNPINLFLTVGAGIANYRDNKWARYEIGGAGLQINIKSELYFLVQANYRYSLDENLVPHNMFYSFGVTRSVYSKKKQSKPEKIKDSDKDGVPDNIDLCPDSSGIAALYGCPDRDADGIADKDDLCPDQKGKARYGGCPTPDMDKDGINDEEDKCPCDFGVVRYQGCPIPDSDKDGINDEEDKCPNQIGTKENKGCPVISKEVKKAVNLAAKNILFETASANLRPQSFKGLNDVVKIMQENPGIKLDINGHTDDHGTDERNQLLSENRAASVRDYIISKGISESRITATGFGETRPIADNKTPAGRAQNRRVELVLGY